jgi:hypothetical protein
MVSGALLKGKSQFSSCGAFLPESVGRRRMPFVAEKLSLVSDQWFMCWEIGRLEI